MKIQLNIESEGDLGSNYTIKGDIDGNKVSYVVTDGIAAVRARVSSILENPGQAHDVTTHPEAGVSESGRPVTTADATMSPSADVLRREQKAQEFAEEKRKEGEKSASAQADAKEKEDKKAAADEKSAADKKE